MWGEDPTRSQNICSSYCFFISIASFLLPLPIFLLDATGTPIDNRNFCNEPKSLKLAVKLENQTIILYVENYVEVTGIYQEGGDEKWKFWNIWVKVGKFCSKSAIKKLNSRDGVKKLVGKVKIIKLILFTIFIFFLDTFAPHFYMTSPLCRATFRTSRIPTLNCSNFRSAVKFRELPENR